MLDALLHHPISKTLDFFPFRYGNRAVLMPIQ